MEGAGGALDDGERSTTFFTSLIRGQSLRLFLFLTFSLDFNFADGAAVQNETEMTL